MSADLRRLGPHWQIWIDWYDDILAGTPPGRERSEEWEMAFTDVGEPLPWDDGAEAVNTEIARRLGNLKSDKPTEHEAEINKPALSKTGLAATKEIQNAIARNNSAIILSIEPLMASIELEIEKLQSIRPNSEEAQKSNRESIAQYETLLNQLRELQAALKKFASDKNNRHLPVTQSLSFSEGVSAWWAKHHERICASAVSTGLRATEAGIFVGCVSICAMAGVNSWLTTGLTAALIGGRPIVEALKSLSRFKGP
jgi:hypothetical protein